MLSGHRSTRRRADDVSDDTLRGHRNHVLLGEVEVGAGQQLEVCTLYHVDLCNGSEVQNKDEGALVSLFLKEYRV